MNHDTSQLEQVIPIPIDNPSDEEELDHINSERNYRKRRNHVISILGKVQKYSAYTFGTFVGIHLTSVIIVPILPIDHDIKQEIFEMGRNIYHGIPQFENIVIFGSSIVHVLSGITIRLLRMRSRPKIIKKNKVISNNDEFHIIDDTRDDIGLGGITNFLGLGYKKSWVSKTLGISPLNFSGYLLIPHLLYHMYKFRLIPLMIDNDSSLINLNYIMYYLNVENIEYVQPYVNILGLSLLTYIGIYHFINGLCKYFKKFSPTWKKIGFSFVNGGSLIGLIVIYNFKYNNSHDKINPNDFFGKNFLKYLTWGYI
ncbi:hypothetical protein DFJ63DRAFT_68360 [Scheffersomyces coipomensis]|uniref:uncharacterized protein n=1 Tax=Scheffersomyces coipomensis TaxID=1788519 RepID=UPI00315D7307